MALHLDEDEFAAVVEAELDALPAGITDLLENVAFVIEDRSEDGDDLLGRYDGVDLTHRGQYGFGELPDRILLFRLPHLAAADTVEALRDEVRTTLVHEIGHFHGLDDDRLHDLGWA